KFFEYSHARLPLVVSDVRTMAQTTLETGQGEVFRADDLDDYLHAVSAILAEPDRYRKAYDQPGLLESWSWAGQARILDDIYSRLSPGLAPSTQVLAEALAVEGVEGVEGIEEVAEPA